MKGFKSLIVLFCMLGVIIFPNLKPITANAQTITAVSSGVAVNGAISASGSNTYQFTTNKDGEAYIILDQSTAGLDMTLTDVHGNYVKEAYFYNGGGSGAIDASLTKGTYYITINPKDWNGTSSATYRLKATYPGAFTRNATTFEPNDTYETAYPVSSGKFYNSKLETNLDSDTYQFTTNKDGEAYITLDQSTAGLDMTLTDAHGNYVKEAYFYNGGGSGAIDVSLPKGTYYIAINSKDWKGVSSATYRLRATYPGAFTRDPATLEPNDTLETAYSIISGKSYSSSLFSPLDSDVYKFTTARDGNVAISLDKSTDGLALTLYDAYGNYIDQSYFYSGGGKASINENLQKGTYYVSVYQKDWNGTTSTGYRLTAAFPDKTPAVNPVSDQSTVITGTAESNSKVYAYVGNTRLGYAIASGGKYSIKIAKQKAGTVIRVYTIDSAGNQSADRTVTVLDKTPPAAPTVNTLTSKTTVITGKTESYATVYVYSGSKVIGTGKADSKGNFRVSIKSQKKGSTLAVYAMDAAKNRSAAKVVKVY